MHKTNNFQRPVPDSRGVLFEPQLEASITALDRFGERYPFLRQRQLAGLDQREIEDFVDQLQQIPPRLENLIDASLLGGRWRRRTGIL
jgi:hypothetical protein